MFADLTHISPPLLIVLKSTAVLLAAALAVLACRQKSAAMRHAVWTVCAASILTLPLLDAVVPAWRLAVLPAGDEIRESVREPDDAASDSALERGPTIGQASRVTRRSVEPSEQEDLVAGQDNLRSPARESSETTIIAGTDPSPASVEGAPLLIGSDRVAEPGRTVFSSSSFIRLWLAGSLLLCMNLLASYVRVWRLVRRAGAIDPESRLGRIMRTAYETIGPRRTVALRMSDQDTIPFACGLFRPYVVIPADAGEWTDEKLRTVLRHELAHVRRRDCFTQLLAQVACAMYWFNPLVWWMALRMRVERERACDDLVLNAGACPQSYGEILLSVAGGRASTAGAPYAALAMARKSTLEGRLLAIVDPDRNRSGVTRVLLLGASIVALLIALPIASLQLVGSEGGDETFSAMEPEVQPGERRPEEIASRGDVPQPVIEPEGGISVADMEELLEVGGTLMVNAQRHLRNGERDAARQVIEDVLAMQEGFLDATRGTPYSQLVTAGYSQFDSLLALIDEGNLDRAADRIDTILELGSRGRELLTGDAPEPVPVRRDDIPALEASEGASMDRGEARQIESDEAEPLAVTEELTSLFDSFENQIIRQMQVATTSLSQGRESSAGRILASIEGSFEMLGFLEDHLDSRQKAILMLRFGPLYATVHAAGQALSEGDTEAALEILSGIERLSIQREIQAHEAQEMPIASAEATGYATDDDRSQPGVRYQEVGVEGPGMYLFGEDRVDEDEMRARLENLWAVDENVHVRIRAARNVDFQVVVDLVNIIRAGGLDNISVQLVADE